MERPNENGMSMNVIIGYMKSWLLPAHQVSAQQNTCDNETLLNKWWVEIPGVIIIPCAAWAIICAYGEPAAPSILLSKFPKWAVVGALTWIGVGVCIRSWLLTGVMLMAVFFGLMIA